MFSVETKKYGEVRVSFKHNNPTTKKGTPLFTIGGRGTHCRIQTEGEDAETISRGQTLLSPKDQYCKDRGRKLSLARALKDAGFNYKQRTMFWEKYFETQQNGKGG